MMMWVVRAWEGVEEEAEGQGDIHIKAKGARAHRRHADTEIRRMVNNE